MEFHETQPLLSNLLLNGKKPTIHNTHKLQNDNADTCGRWVCARVLNADKSLPEFIRQMTGGGSGSPDEKVTNYTVGLLHK